MLGPKATQAPIDFLSQVTKIRDELGNDFRLEIGNGLAALDVKLSAELSRLQVQLSKDIHTTDTVLRDYAEKKAESGRNTALAVFAFTSILLGILAFFGIKELIRQAAETALTTEVLESTNDLVKTTIGGYNDQFNEKIAEADRVVDALRKELEEFRGNASSLTDDLTQQLTDLTTASASRLAQIDTQIEQIESSIRAATNENVSKLTEETELSRRTAAEAAAAAVAARAQISNTDFLALRDAVAKQAQDLDSMRTSLQTEIRTASQDSEASLASLEAKVTTLFRIASSVSLPSGFQYYNVASIDNSAPLPLYNDRTTAQIGNVVDMRSSFLMAVVTDLFGNEVTVRMPFGTYVTAKNASNGQILVFTDMSISDLLSLPN